MTDDSKAETTDSVIQLFAKFDLWPNITYSWSRVSIKLLSLCSLQMLWGRGLSLTQKKNKDLPTINYKSLEIKSLDSVTYPQQLIQRYGPYASH